MTRRLLALVVLAVLAVFGLTACRSNVGVAATIQGHQISESTLSDYVTANSKPVPVQFGSATISAPPRPFVLETLVDDQLYTAVLEATPQGVPNKGQLAQARQATLAGKTPAAVAKQIGVRGYPSALVDLVVRARTKLNVLLTYRDHGVNVEKAVLKAEKTFHVTISPRYGKWDPKSLTILSPNPYGSLPGYIKFQSVPPSTAPAGP